MCILERPADQPGMPLVYPRAIAPLIDTPRARDPDPSAPERPDHPHLLFGNSVEGIDTREPPVFNMGSMQERDGDNNHKPCLTSSDGLQANSCSVSPLSAPALLQALVHNVVHQENLGLPARSSEVSSPSCC